MSHGKIGFLIVTIAVLAISLPIIGLVYKAIPNSQNQHDQKSAQSHNSDQRSSKTTPARNSIGSFEHLIDNLAGNVDRRPDSEGSLNDEDHRNEQDLVAQRVMARWTFGIFVFTGLSVVFVGLGTWLLYLTLRESQKVAREAVKATKSSDIAAAATLKAAEAATKANAINRQAFVDQQRAWLTLDIEKSDFETPFYWNDSKGWVDVNLIFRNFGTTPAYKARLVTEFVIGTENIDKARNDIAKTLVELPLNVGYTVVPNENLPQKFRFSIVREMADVYIQQQILFGADEKRVDFCLFIVGCMSYELAFKNGRRDTLFAIGIERTRDNKWNSPDPRPELGEVSYSELRFERWPVGDISPE